MLMNNKFKAQTLTGNPTGNYRCQLFASHALNMSCYFSQSARSIESRCVVNHMASLDHNELQSRLTNWSKALVCQDMKKIFCITSPLWRGSGNDWRIPVTKGQWWRAVLLPSLFDQTSCWTSIWVASDLRSHDSHDVIAIMIPWKTFKFHYRK